jgi:hypothetical protein
LEVVVEVGRYIRKTVPDGVRSPAVLVGFLAGIVLMYATGLLAG